MKKIRRMIIIISLLIILCLCVLIGVYFFGEDRKAGGEFSDSGEDIVRYILPEEEIVAQPGETVTLTVVAKCEAEITVKTGTKKIAAEKEEDAEGYTAFRAFIEMPESAVEIDSLGSVYIIAMYNGKALQLQGPKIISGEEMTTNAPVVSPNGTTTQKDFGNYIPEVTQDIYSTVHNITTTTVYTPSTTYQYTPYTGNQMCVVTDAYADTRDMSTDNLVPYYAPLVAGTMDYVTGESSGYNADEQETDYYYHLQSGKKVKREAVKLMPKTDMGNNSISVLSCAVSGGELKITLSTEWKVPYDLTYSPQNYYNAYKKNYNVTSFTATAVELMFHYTESATGNIDTSGSDVLSSAYWKTDSANKTASLVMNLKKQGGYYGSSLEYDSSGNMVITINRRPPNVNDAVVMLDPGHGGKDPGAVGISGQIRECDVNYAVAYAAMEELQKKGVTVYFTRSGDQRLSLEERKAIMRSVKPDLFVSVHSNGSEFPERKGTSTYYFKPFSFSLANNIYNELLSVHRNHFYYGRQELYNELADNVQYYPFSVTRVEDCPSVLIEVGYMTNDEECYKLIEPSNQKLLGKAVADGIIRTLSEAAV